MDNVFVFPLFLGISLLHWQMEPVRRRQKKQDSGILWSQLIGCIVIVQGMFSEVNSPAI